MTTESTIPAEGLPVLPRPACTYADHSFPAFSKAQMEAYAREAIAAWNTRAAPPSTGATVQGPLTVPRSIAVSTIIEAWVREDLDTGAKMSIGFHAPKLIARLEAAQALRVDREAIINELLCRAEFSYLKGENRRLAEECADAILDLLSAGQEEGRP